METKTLLPAATMPPMSKIHTDRFYGYENYNEAVLLRLQEAKNRARREYLFRKCLRQNLAFHHYPTCDLDQVLNVPLKNGDYEITTAKIQLERQLQQESKSESESDSESEPLPELELDPIPKLDPQPESTLESKPIPKPGSELERKSEVNQESDLMFQAEVQSRLGKKYDIRTLTPSWRLALLAVEDWQQELSSVLESGLKKLELKQLPSKNVEWEMWEKLETTNDWFEFLDAVDVLKYRTNECSVMKLSNQYVKHYRKLSEKSWKKSKIFITKASADRTLSSASIFMKCCKPNENLSRRNLRSAPYPQNGQRSLLRSQQNNMQQNNMQQNNILPCTNSLVNNDNPQLLSNQENNLDQNQNSQNIVTSNNQQRIKEEEDDKESIEEEIQRTLSDFHMTSRNKIIVEVSDEEEELVFQHDHTDLAQQLSEYISEESLKESLKSETTSSKTEKKTRPNQQKQHWRKNEGTQQQDEITRNTLNDHCYHLNEPDPRIVERLRGGEHESDDDDDDDDDDESVDDEEIDVVSCGKQPSAYFNPVQTLYRYEAGPSTSRAGPSTSRAGASKSRGKSSQSRAKSSRFTPIAGSSTSKLANENNTTVRRPRGRPPGKNSAQQRRNQSRTNQILNHVSTHYVQQTNRQQNIEQDYQQNSPEPNLQQNIQQDENLSRSEAIERRKQHNEMEKQRREIQTKALHDLRGCIPNIANNKRASKVSILAHARDFISELCEMISINEHTVNSEMKRHMYLHSKIAKLKKPVDLKCKIDCFLKRRKEKVTMQPCVTLQRV